MNVEHEDLSKTRTEVIEKFINLEMIINTIISQHFFGYVKTGFLFDVLYDEYFTFGLKRRILEKIVSNIDKGMVDKLNRLNTIRNYFAHCGTEIFWGKEHPEKGEKGVIPDPRRWRKPLDFAALYKEFTETEPQVTQYLFDIYKKLGGHSEKA